MLDTGLDPYNRHIRNYARALLIGLVMFSLGAFVPTPANAEEENNLNQSGIAIHGYDPVAYFQLGKPTLGDSSFTAQYEGATFTFSTEANQSTFMSNPGHYAPAYGGWCSYGVRVGKKFDVDPNAWKIVDERLYLQLDQGTQLVWEKDLQTNIEVADRLWPNLKSVPVDILGD